jgi:hypothetical protein
MGYDIIKSIKIKDNKVFLTSTANNVRPRTFKEWHCESLTRILIEQGQEALDVEILEEYESGNFQAGGQNKYTRALKVLTHMPEYKAFDWRVSFGEEYDKVKENRKKEAFTELLKKALKTKLPIDKFILISQYNGKRVYLSKVTSRHAFWTHDLIKAKIFKYAGDAERVKGYFRDGNNWEVSPC